MPRTITGPERTRLSNGHANYYTRVEVKDGAAAWRDLTSEGGMDYVDGVSWGETVDSPTATGSLSLKREQGGFSLAPLVATSALNLISGSYAPLLNVSRQIRISTAVTLPGVAPVSGDWKEVFIGKLGDIDDAADPMTISFSDLGQFLLEAQIETERVYGDPGGVPVESVMQQILDDNLGAGSVTLVVPVSPTWNILPYKQATGSILDALRTLALQIGWDVRYRYDSSGVSQLTFFSVDRAKTTPDFTIDADEYIDVQRLEMSDADVRNVVKVNYQNKSTLIVASEEASDSGSIAEFGRRYMEIGEGSSSNIDTAEEALAMAVAAVTDLLAPLADQAVVQFYFWPVQCGDLIRYVANGVHYTDDQDWGIVGFQHSLGLNSHRTVISVRGSIAGAYRQWLLTRNGIFSGQISTGPSPIIPPLQAEAQAFQDPAEDGSGWQQVIFEKAAARIDIYGLESASPGVPVPELAENRRTYSLVRQEGDLWNKDDQAFIVAIATRTGYYRKTISFGVGYDGTRGPTVVWEKQAVDVGTPPSAPPSGLTVIQTGTTIRVSWTIGDPDAFHILFRNGYGIVLEPGVNTVLDTNVNAEIEYHYQVCAWRNGQTSALASGVVVPPATSSVSAPQWLAGYPKSLSSNGAEYRWTSDPATTRIVIETSGFLITTVFTALPGGVLDAPDVNVPNGALIDTSYPPGTRVQARIRATIAGVDYFSLPASVTYGTPALVAPVFYGGTPWNAAGNVNVQWRLASTAATALRVILLAEPAIGLTPAQPMALLYQETVSALIQAGSVDIANPVTLGGVSTPLANRRVVLQAIYPTGSATSSVARINVAP